MLACYKLPVNWCDENELNPDVLCINWYLKYGWGRDSDLCSQSSMVESILCGFIMCVEGNV